MSALRTLTALPDPSPLTLPSQLPAKVSRSLSVTSVTSAVSAFSSASSISISSAYSRVADDMLERFISQREGTSIRLWSAGNAAIGTPSLHLTMEAKEVHELVDAMQADDRFEFLSLAHLDEEKEEWSASFRRTGTITTPPLSDSE